MLKHFPGVIIYFRYLRNIIILVWLYGEADASEISHQLLQIKVVHLTVSDVVFSGTEPPSCFVSMKADIEF